MQLYAVIKSGDREYRVTPGKTVKVDQIDLEPGQVVEFDEVGKLVRGDQVALGQPLVPGARVRAEVVKHGQDKGVIVFRMNRRRLYQKKNDRLWRYTVLRINEIQFGDEVFDKRDLDTRKIRKARAAELAERKKQARKAPPPPPHQPAPPREAPSPAVAPPSATISNTVETPPQTTAPPPKAQGSSRRWWPLALLMLLVAVAVWRYALSPSTPKTVASPEPTAAELALQQTLAVDQPTDPTQPPD